MLICWSLKTGGLWLNKHVFLHLTTLFPSHMPFKPRLYLFLSTMLAPPRSSLFLYRLISLLSSLYFSLLHILLQKAISNLFFFSLTWQLTCEQSLEQNSFWRDREHQSLDELNFIPKNEKSSYSPKLRLIYHTCHSFPLKQTETNSGGLERRGNFARLIVLVYRTCYLF